MGHLRTTALLAAASGIAALAAAPSAGADPVADFYKGKTITLVISAGPGGGYAAYSTTTLEHMVRHIPGKPSYRRQHRQGAGGLVAAKYMYTKAPRDGTEIATVHRESVSTLPLFRGRDKLGFNPAEFGWIGSIDSSTSLCVAWETAPVNKFEDLYTTPLIVGGVGPGSGMDLFPRLVNNLFDTKLQLVTGYPSGSAVALAMQRGEVQGRCAWSWSSIVSRYQGIKDKLKLLVQFSLKKNAALPDVPLIMDLTKTQEQRDIIELVIAPLQMARPLLAPPGIPKERLAALRAAFDATMKDDAYLAEMKKQKLVPQPLSGAEIEKLISKIYSQPQSLVDKAKEATTSTDKIKIAKKEIPVVEVTSEVSATKRGGRRISFKTDKGETHTVSVSGSRTKVTIDGKASKRKNVEVGMTCTFAYQGDKTEAKSIACK